VILVLDQEEPATEDLAFGAMVSAQVSIALERWQAQMTHRATVAAAERVRLARDLHDGVLQFLAGAALQLEGLLRAGNLPVAAKVRLMGLRQALSDEQRELRAFINAMRPTRPNEAAPAIDLAEELEELADHLSRYWNICVVADVARDLRVPTEIAYDIDRIVREAVANAVRHGRAGNVTVTARPREAVLALEIADDGSGFPFRGEMQDEELRTAGVGPRSLQERARSMGGRVRLSSGPRGARLGIELPLERMAA
jgi:signal transduction histidine kinase